jgi:hypothetical protein
MADSGTDNRWRTADGRRQTAESTRVESSSYHRYSSHSPCRAVLLVVGDGDGDAELDWNGSPSDFLFLPPGPTRRPQNR